MTEDDRYIEILEPVRALVMLEDRFAFNKKRRFHWLQRLLLWGLAKLGCHAWDETLSVSRFRPKAVLEALRRQRIAALKWGVDRPLEMVIGTEDFEELMGLPEFRYAFEFHVPRDHRDRKFMGMHVRVVPWIKGVVVYPR